MIALFLGVFCIPLLFVGGYSIIKMYQRVGIINTILFAGAVPFMILGLKKAISEMFLLIKNNNGDIEINLMLSPELVIGLGLLALAFIWTIGKAFVISHKRKADLNNPKD